jgi:nicotinate-nucleotide pyrophosphorylase (carboxylating)
MDILEFAKEVLAEDIGRGDLFERVAKPKEATAKIVAKSNGVFAGKVYANAIAKELDIKILWQIDDGENFEPKRVIAKVLGDARAILKGERAILNTILHASSIATKAKEFVELSEGRIKVLDTRKSRPLLREFEKYASRVGGVINHRMGLDDCLMLKDTHLNVLGEEFESFIEKARKKIPFTSKIEVECESFEMAKRAFEAKVDIVMCDNMDISEIKRVVELRDKTYSHILLEVSGNITKENIKNYMELGIDAVSSGAIFHQAVWPDISMKIDL